MGVPGLWGLLKPASHQIDLRTLQGKIVAIDMNVWLHQAVKSRTATGGVKNYLSVLFKRLCKLLYFDIRPVFVFDGDVPALKKLTMAYRRITRNKLTDKANLARTRLLRRLLKRLAETVLKPNSTSDAADTSPLKVKVLKDSSTEKVKSELLLRLSQNPDVQQAVEDSKLYTAPSLPSCTESNAAVLLSECAGEEYDQLARDFLDTFECYSDLNGIPSTSALDSDSFKVLPLQAQLRVVQLSRERLDRPSFFQASSHFEAVESEAFSSGQLSRLLLRRQLSELEGTLSATLARDEASRHLSGVHSADLTALLQSKQIQSVDKTEQEHVDLSATALRIQSQASGHAVLIKRTTSGDKMHLSKSSSTQVKLKLESLIQSDEDLNLLQPSDVCKFQHKSPTSISESNRSPIETPGAPSSTCSISTSTELHPRSPDKQLNPNFCSDGSVDVEHIKVIDIPVDERAILCAPFEANDIHLTSPSNTIDVCDQSVPAVLESSLRIADGREDEDLAKSVNTSSPSSSDDEFIDVEAQDSEVELSSINDESDDNRSTVDSLTPFKDDSANSTLPKSQIMFVDEEENDDNCLLDDNVLREEADRLSRQARSTTNECMQEAKELLDLFGMPYLISPEEAEAQCVALQRSGTVYLVASEDSDVWPFGANLVCRRLFGGQPRRSVDDSGTLLYSLDAIRDKIGLTPSALLRLVLLCGSDYTSGVTNVGPVTAMEILTEFPPHQDQNTVPTDEQQPGCLGSDIDIADQIVEPLRRFANWCHCQKDRKNSPKTANPVRRRWNRLKPPPNFPDVRIVNAYLKPSVITAPNSIRWKAPDITMLVRHAVSVLGWQKVATETMLETVMKQHRKLHLDYISCPKTLITHHFPLESSSSKKRHSETLREENANKDEMPLFSKRLRKASSRLANAKSPEVPMELPVPQPATSRKRDRKSRKKADASSFIDFHAKATGTCQHSKILVDDNQSAVQMVTTRISCKRRRKVVPRVDLSEDDEL